MPITYLRVSALYAKGYDARTPGLSEYLLGGMPESENKNFVISRATKYCVGNGEIEIIKGGPPMEVLVLFAQMSARDLVEYRLTFDTSMVVRFED